MQDCTSRAEKPGRLLVASRNPGKIREFQRMLAGTGIEAIGLDDAGVEEEIEETGKTFDENARLKAVGYARASGELTLADDSGLEVDALGGEPGVRSARFGGPGLNDSDRTGLLLENLDSINGWQRQARYRVVLALAGPGVPDGVITTEGTVEGAIAHQPVGEGGFGYDPVFWLPDRARTMAQLSASEKDEISHRGVAMRKMIAVIESIIRA